MIPRIIHQIWVGEPPPQHITEWMASWQALPGWQYRLWDDEAIEAFGLTNINLYRQVEDLVGPDEVGQLKSDIARLEILHRFGGVYVDADMELLKPIDSLVEPPITCFVAREDAHWLNNAVFGCEPSHLFLAELIALLPQSVARSVARGVKRPNKMSGPQFITRMYRRGWEGKITIYPSSYFYPYLWSELERGNEEFPDSFTVHHWHHRRTTREHGHPVPGSRCD